MPPPDALFSGSIGSSKRSVAKEEGAGARNSDDDNEPDLLKLSPVGEVLRRATEAGSGVLSIGRCVPPLPTPRAPPPPPPPAACEAAPQRRDPSTRCSCTPRRLRVSNQL